MNFCTTAS